MPLSGIRTTSPHDRHDRPGRVGPRECYPAFTLDQAIERLAGDTDAADDVLIFGSLYLAGEALAANGEAPD